jgi:hypothetical protein
VHVHVGIEDNLWRLKGERMTTVQQIEQMVRIAKELGREVVTAADARRILKIDTWYNGVDEALFNLGLPPVRQTGQQTFLTYETTSFPGTLAVTAATAYALFQTIVMALVALGWGRWGSAKVSISRGAVA